MSALYGAPADREAAWHPGVGVLAPGGLWEEMGSMFTVGNT